MTMPLIDIHTHTFPTAAMGQRWLGGSGIMNPAGSGGIDEHLAVMEHLSISAAVMLMYTPTRYMYEARLLREPLPLAPMEREAKER
jgi:hypothetical protein